eukprot:6197311-Pleurochrysis_carterae.AAC.1
MGHSGQVPEEVAMLREVSSRPGIATVCEIGMNAGHSALCMLEGRKTNLVEFDLFQLRYSNATARFLDALYPGRISFHPGSSLQTVPVYARNVTELGGAPPCDAFFIDGDHGHGAPSKDLEHALRASSDDAVIVMDDCAPRFPQVVAAWQNATAAGLVMPESQTVLHLPEPAGQQQAGCPEAGLSSTVSIITAFIERTIQTGARDGLWVIAGPLCDATALTQYSDVITLRQMCALECDRKQCLIALRINYYHSMLFLPGHWLSMVEPEPG